MLVSDTKLNANDLSRLQWTSEVYILLCTRQGTASQLTFVIKIALFLRHFELEASSCYKKKNVHTNNKVGSCVLLVSSLLFCRQLAHMGSTASNK